MLAEFEIQVGGLISEASHARACHSIGLRPKNRYCSFGAVSPIGLRPIDIARASL